MLILINLWYMKQTCIFARTAHFWYENECCGCKNLQELHFKSYNQLYVHKTTPAEIYSFV